MSLLAPACGEVASGIDAGNSDCGPGRHQGYSGLCEPNCTAGGCGTDGTCNETSGQCEYRSCLHLKQAVTSIGDGVWPIRPVAEEPAFNAYCAGNWTYKRIGFGNYNQDLGPAFKGWDQIRVSDLQSALTQTAVVWGYNRQSGLANISPGFSGGECCFKSVYDGQGDFTVGGASLTPANLNGDANCGGPYTDTAMRIVHVDGALPMLTEDFFRAGVSVGPQCAEADNPALFAERFTGLASCQEIGDASMWEGIGIYTIDSDGLGTERPREAVCGAAGGDTLGDVAIGRAGATYTGYTQLAATGLADPAVQLALLRTYGRNQGLPNLEPGLTVGTCCVASGAGFLALDGVPLNIAHDVGGGCTGGFTETAIKLSLNSAIQQAPLPRNYFTSRAPTATATGCAAGEKPALFMRKD
ncbi:MAG: hypothetical protein SFX73_31465 [Kofleriaceae bacterium]|nr:hypothetical protein [Kofleriaceae bacterium]